MATLSEIFSGSKLGSGEIVNIFAAGASFGVAYDRLYARGLSHEAFQEHLNKVFDNLVGRDLPGTKGDVFTREMANVLKGLMNNGDLAKAIGLWMGESRLLV